MHISQLVDGVHIRRGYRLLPNIKKDYKQRSPFFVLTERICLDETKGFPKHPSQYVYLNDIILWDAIARKHIALEWDAVSLS